MMYKGDIIIIPTDTVFGFASLLHDQEGLKKINHLKGIKKPQPIPILISNVNQLKEIAVINRKSELLMRKYWPGHLTIIFKTTPEFFEKTKEETVAIRMPKHPIPLKLIDMYGPLRVTSLTLPEEKPINEFKAIEKQFKKHVKEIYPQGQIPKSDQSSTIVDVTKRGLKIVRPGAISEAELLETIK
ncbi:MAG: L-threonylcarbamoyladenylate synthase [Acholeplasmataceae bacterium]|nr:L-threonylcarbamoyladenylate synthase [Acholeplasmataceae bacterium]